MKRAPRAKPEDAELVVFISSSESTCGECGQNLGKKSWFRLTENKTVLCLTCADLDHLIFLPAGNVALTRRSKKYSTLSAPVLYWNARRRRYECQGLLVELAALERAEAECLADSDVRELQRERAAVRREGADAKFIAEFALRVRKEFPGLPPGREEIIAQHACEKYSGRVGRTASAKDLEAEPIRLAVIAHIRHLETDYDDRLMKGQDRREARAAIKAQIDHCLRQWEK